MNYTLIFLLVLQVLILLHLFFGLRFIKNRVLFYCFKLHYKGQIIRRTRDYGLNKIDMLDLEVLEIREDTLLVKILATGCRTVVIKNVFK